MYDFLNLPYLCIFNVFFGNLSMKAMKGQEGIKIDPSWIQLWNISYLDSNAPMSNVWFWCW